VVGAGLRVVIVSYGPDQFRFLRETLVDAGHAVVAYLYSRSMRPSQPVEPEFVEATTAIVAALPPDMDLLLPGGTGMLAPVLSAYEPDVLMVHGFNWRLPRDVLDVPRLGTLNVHPSALPKYRGPSPVLWAIRNGDPYLGVTVHRMTERIDAGPILAQIDNIPMPDLATAASVWKLMKPALPALLDEALDRAVRGDPGTPQDEDEATYAGFPPPDWFTVTWQGSRLDLHNQIRLLRYLKGGDSPFVEFQGSVAQIQDTSLTDNGGTRLDCSDGPLWVTSTPAP